MLYLEKVYFPELPELVNVEGQSRQPVQEFSPLFLYWNDYLIHLGIIEKDLALPLTEAYNTKLINCNYRGGGSDRLRSCFAAKVHTGRFI